MKHTTITIAFCLSMTLTACTDEDETLGVEPLDQRISQSTLIDQARAFIGTWDCVAQNALPGLPAFESEDQLTIASSAGDTWVRWEFEQLVTPDDVPPARGADLWGPDGQSGDLVRYRVDNGGGHGPLYSGGFVDDGDRYTLTWDGEVYVPSIDALNPLRHSFTISDADDTAGQFDAFDTVVSLGMPDGSFATVVTGHCERRL